MESDVKAAVLGAALGGVLGFSLPYLAAVLDRIRATKRFAGALGLEVQSGRELIASKMEWLGRDVTGHLHRADASRVVDFGGIKLYLGEREEFEVPVRFWTEQYTEIVLALEPEQYARFARIYGFFSDFSKKFEEMKKSFKYTDGDSKVMALACHDDLKRLAEKIKQWPLPGPK